MTIKFYCKLNDAFFFKKKNFTTNKTFQRICFVESTVVLLKLGKFQNLPENWIFLSFICGYFYIENENRRPYKLCDSFGYFGKFEFL